MNRIDEAFNTKKDLLNVYFTAGYPKLDDTLKIASHLEKGGADMIEIGIPFSDPIADGPTIQESSSKALENGMSLNILFDQLKGLRDTVSIPVLLMGYLNPIIQFGLDKFCRLCSEVGVDGVIIPDLPIKEYIDEYASLFQSFGVKNTFLISPTTSEERIRLIDDHTDGFIYMVSSSSTTGAKASLQDSQLAYFERIKSMKLKNPRLIGFGISSNDAFKKACIYAHGAIVGSAFIDLLSKDYSENRIHDFVHSIKGK